MAKPLYPLHRPVSAEYDFDDGEQTVVEAAAAVDPPIAVKPTVLLDQAISFVRIMGVAIGLIVALLGFVQTRDIAGAMEFVRSSDLLPTLGTLTSAGLLLWSTLRTRKQKQKLITAADAAPDDVAYVVRPFDDARRDT